jgi:hypothetical protein
LVRTTSSTIIIDDESEGSLKLMDLELIPGTVAVEVTGLERRDSFGARYIEALKIESEGSDDGVESIFELSGELQAIDASTITVLDVKMDADDGAFDGVSRADLQDLLVADAPVFVEVVYTFEAGYVATEIKLED